MFVHKKESSDALEFAGKIAESWEKLRQKGDQVTTEDLQALKNDLIQYRKILAMAPSSQNRSSAVGRQRYADLIAAAIRRQINVESSDPSREIKLPSDEELEKLGTALDKFREVFYRKIVTDKEKKQFKYEISLSEQDHLTALEVRGAYETSLALIRFETAAALYGFLDACIWPGDPEPKDEKKGKKREPKDAPTMLQWMEAAVNARVQNACKELCTLDVFDAQISGVARYARTGNSAKPHVLCDQEPETVSIPLNLIDETLGLRKKVFNKTGEQTEVMLSANRVAAVITLAVMLYTQNKHVFPSSVTVTTMLPVPFGSQGAAGFYLSAENQENALKNALDDYASYDGKLVQMSYASLGGNQIAMLGLSQHCVEELRKADQEKDTAAAMILTPDSPRAVFNKVHEYCLDVRMQEEEERRRNDPRERLLQRLSSWEPLISPEDPAPDRAAMKNIIAEMLNAQIDKFIDQPPEKLIYKEKCPLVKVPFAKSDGFWLVKLAAAMRRGSEEVKADGEVCSFTRAELTADGILNQLIDQESLNRLREAQFVAQCNRLFLEFKNGQFTLHLKRDIPKAKKGKCQEK